jgi:regulator of protease activity HflC (stomatin/prohibitin superfamily)
VTPPRPEESRAAREARLEREEQERMFARVAASRNPDGTRKTQAQIEAEEAIQAEAEAEEARREEERGNGKGCYDSRSFEQDF